jgi:hypothetical protein
VTPEPREVSLSQGCSEEYRKGHPLDIKENPQKFKGFGELI